MNPDETPVREAPKPLADAEIRDLAKAMSQGQILVHQEVPTHVLPIVFMPITFGVLQGFSREALGQITVYGNLAKDHLGPGVINGFPVFFSARIALTSCVLRAAQMAEAMEAAADAVEVPE